MKFGWIPDIHDTRDYTKDTTEISSLLKQTAPSERVDLRKYCTPIFNQGNIGSCTANAAAGICEFSRKKALGVSETVSRLFIYKATRNLMQQTGDTGAYIRTTMGALVLFGAPPEKYWEYSEKEIDSEPPAFCYSFAQNYQALKYFRLDEQAKSEEKILQNIRETLAGEIPVMFGFTVYNSIREAKEGKIPFPEKGESVLGGHAVLAVGYDDGMRIGKSTGAFIIRNSWGDEWGDKGYGYLPYEYVLQGLALDWWALISAEWVNVKEFGI